MYGPQNYLSFLHKDPVYYISYNYVFYGSYYI